MPTFIHYFFISSYDDEPPYYYRTTIKRNLNQEQRPVMSIKPVINKLRGKGFGGNNVVTDSFDSSDHQTILYVENQVSLFTSTIHPTNQDTYKIFVSSWNVGGIRPPAEDIGMEDWLNLENCPADIYVFGFQEIVPLSPGNVLKYENSKVCVGWNSLLGAALNKNNNNKVQEGLREEGKQTSQEFKCIISKQMVGIFLSVWARSDLCSYIKHSQVSSVGCGIMGCLGNKGSVSVRFFLRETSFCFVCSHLASGGRDGDKKHRNEDAADILSRTSFSSHGSSRNLPTKILDHDRVVWLGDLNYRIHLADSMTRSLVEKRKWDVLLEKDQLKAEFMEGHVFQGWQEGVIEFAPTYKYYPNSEVYYGCVDRSCNQKRKNEKIRAPAWCDRIIWFGEGLKQSKYERVESKLSDHRPVRAIFTAEVEVFRGSTRFSTLLSERIDCLTRTKST